MLTRSVDRAETVRPISFIPLRGCGVAASRSAFRGGEFHDPPKLNSGVEPVNLLLRWGGAESDTA
jgi:hypothetical protein